MKNLKNYLIAFAILAMSGTTSLAQSNQNKLEGFSFLVGDFDVKVMLPDGTGGWREGGSGTAKFYPILGNTFVREEITTTMGNYSFNMDNTFGRDGRSGQPRLIALDKEYSVMDVYYGKVMDKKLVYNNLSSDTPAKSPRGEEISFRVTYSMVSEKENQVFVEMTKNKGSTWLPFAKNRFIRKNSN